MLHRLLSTRFAIIATVLGVALAAPISEASASGHVTLGIGDHITIPSWIFGQTTVCATAQTTAGGINMRVHSQWASGSDYIFVPQYTRYHTSPTCDIKWWGGAPVDVTNVGLDPGQVDPGAYLVVDYY